MKMRRWRKSIITRVLSLVMCILFVSFTASPAVYGAKWNGVIRPGFMAGDSDSRTDFFLEMFLPLQGTETSFFFINPHIRLSEGENEGNLGVGFRGIHNDRYIFGANAFFDTMSSVESNRYNQFGLGLELLSRWFDARANYYAPFGDDTNRIRRMDEFAFASSSLLISPGFEEALTGYDAEVGVLIPGISNVMETRAFVGGYSYDSDVLGDTIDGLRYRVEARPTPLVDLTLEVKDDDVRGTDTFIGGYIELPFEDLLSFKVAKDAFAFGKGTRPLKDRMTDKIIRDRQIQTVAGNEVTDSIPMIYVNKDNDVNSDGCGTGIGIGIGICDGSGTLENPYEDISSVEGDSLYKEGTWVYVFSWPDEDGVVRADTYFDIDDTDTVITLLDDMVLWGQGYRMGNL